MDALHPLENWISKNTNQAKFAEDNGLSEGYLSEILSGKKTPSLKLADKLSRATGGRVKIGDFVQREAAE